MSLASATDVSNHTAKSPSKLSEAAWVWAIVGLLAALWGTSVALFGIPGLYIPAVAMVPVVFVALIVVSRG